jgi:hypothetical protein
MATPPHDTRPAPAPPSLGGNPSANDSSNGDSNEAADERRSRRPAGPSTKLALIVLGITGALFVGGIIAQWLASGTPPPPASTAVRQAAGSPLHAEAGRTLIRTIIVGGQPPVDVVDAVIVPAGTTAVTGSAVDRGVETYDRSIRVRVRASQAAVVAFYRAELRVQGWTSISAGAPSGAQLAPRGSVEVLAKRGASDGNFWEIGAVVEPTTFASGRGAGTSGPSSNGSGDVTPVTLRLFVVSDQQ